MILIKVLTDLPIQDLDPLIEESTKEGFSMVRRLKDSWLDKTNRFNMPGEGLYGAFLKGKLVGICGRNIDPYLNKPEVVRLRHLYVLPAFRRQGVAKKLTEKLIEETNSSFNMITLRANDKDKSGYLFYEFMGFQRVDERTTTHVIYLRK